jgi:hypothetical protein
MNESSFPFEGQPGPNGLASMEPEPGDGNRTLLFAAGGVAVALVIGALAYFFVFAGSGDDAVTEAAAPNPVAVAPVPDETAAPVKKQRISAKSFGRDPFEPLISEPVAAVVDPLAGSPVASVAQVTVVPTGTTDATGATEAPVTTGTSTPSSSETHTFKVVEVAPDNGNITVKVDGKMYDKLQAGEVFGTYFKVVLISGQVNSFQFGEEKFNVIGTKRLTIA